MLIPSESLGQQAHRLLRWIIIHFYGNFYMLACRIVRLQLSNEVAVHAVCVDHKQSLHPANMSPIRSPIDYDERGFRFSTRGFRFSTRGFRFSSSSEVKSQPRDNRCSFILTVGFNSCVWIFLGCQVLDVSLVRAAEKADSLSRRTFGSCALRRRRIQRQKTLSYLQPNNCTS